MFFSPSFSSKDNVEHKPVFLQPSTNTHVNTLAFKVLVKLLYKLDFGLWKVAQCTFKKVKKSLKPDSSETDACCYTTAHYVWVCVFVYVCDGLEGALASQTVFWPPNQEHRLGEKGKQVQAKADDLLNVMQKLNTRKEKT